MRQRNMLCGNHPMMNSEMGNQTQSQLHHEPYVDVSSVSNFSQHNRDLHQVPQNHENPLFYGMNQYNTSNNLHQTHSFSLNVYDPYMTHSSSNRVFPGPLNEGSVDNLPQRVHMTDHGRENQFIDGGRGPYKRKNSEGIIGNFRNLQNSNSSASHLNAHDYNLVPIMDNSSFAQSGTHVAMDVNRSVRNRAGAIGLNSILPHNHNNLAQGNYMGQSFHQASNPWLGQQLYNNGDGGVSTWNQASVLPYLQGSNVNGDSTQNIYRSSTTFHPHPGHQQTRNRRHQPSQAQGVGGPHSRTVHAQATTSSNGVRPNNGLHHRTVNPPQARVGTGHRFQGSTQPTGVRFHRSHRRGGGVAEATPSHENLPSLRVMPADEVAMLEFSEYFQVGNFTDRHRDMRMDIDEMSYEELLALGERIGKVNTGLLEETIISYLETRTRVFPTASINSKDSSAMATETECCIVCQAGYENEDRIGTLSCGHEYHTECLKKWLIVKNVCPICKSVAIASESSDG